VPSASACHRRPIILLAAWLLVLQAFLAGVTAAQAVAIVGDPVCHGDGADRGTGGDGPRAAAHACCASCLVAAPVLAPPPAAPGCIVPPASVRGVVWSTITYVIAPGAIRAGASRAPPRHA
jgi:hypothetical protein